MRHKLLAFFASIVWLVAIASATTSQKPGTSTPVPLEVHLELTDSLGTTCAICPDGLGPYVDGQNGVSANFSKYGGLIVDFTSSTMALRTLNFNYNPAGSNSPPPAIPVMAPKTYTALPSTTNAPNLQDMTLGMSQCLGMTWNHTNGGNTTRTHGFRFSGGDLTTTAYALFTCTAADGSGRCTIWEAEPKASACNPPATVSKARVKDNLTVRGKTVTTDYGLFDMPFKLTLIRK